MTRQRAHPLTSLTPLTSLLLWAWGAAASMRFTRPAYDATIYENSAAKTYLESPLKMGVHLDDPAWEVRYKIVSGDDDNLFKAEDHLLGDFSFLRIRTKGGSTAILNREVRDRYSLTVKAWERGGQAECRARVDVRVLDTNDLRPLFSPTSYSVTLAENAPPRASVAKVTATDADVGTNGEYYYSFRQRTDAFAVHPTSGVVTLTGRLDYGETPLYELEIVAEDRGMKLYGSGGFSSTAKLTVRVARANRYAPVVTALALAPSSADPDPVYALVTVEDADPGPGGEVASLVIVAGDPLRHFKTARSKPGSKEFQIKAAEDVDWESRPFGYNLTLQARDDGDPPRFSSVVSVHVAPPRSEPPPAIFEKTVYRGNLSEFAPPGTPVAKVSALPGRPGLGYALDRKSETFAIDPDTGMISTVGPVRSNGEGRFRLGVTADNGRASTTVLVDVLDVNDNAPEFSRTSYRAGVDENAPVGTLVATVKATDGDRGENGYVTYSLADPEPAPFAIDYFTGAVSTSERLDYELMPRVYALKIRASDWGSPFRRESEAVLTVTLNNLNDNDPAFENVDCQVTVPRDHGVGEQITAVSAIDADELQLVRYYIRSGDQLDLFDLNANSGVLSLKKTLSEGAAAATSFHALRIVASDGERQTPPMSMNVTVITARTPVQVKCAETGVAAALAEKLLRGGKIRPASEPDDAFADVHSVNRHAPRFADSFPGAVEVREDVPVGARVARLSALDADGGFNGMLVYVISGGDPENRFVVETETGWLSVYSPLDRESKDRYTLNVTAYDLGIPQKSASRLLDVKILDANDNSPRFLQDSYQGEIGEDAPPGTEILQMAATDKDAGQNGVVRYSILGGSQHFAVHPESGVLTVMAALDRERRPVYDLKIAARDLAEREPQRVSVAPLRIVLDDVNDNPPKFVPPNYRVKVREDLPVGAVVTWLEAHDPDAGPSGQVRYGLTDDGDGTFECDRASGAVRLARALDYESRQVYNLTAKAKDKGKPASLSSTCFVEVEVADVDENLHRPFFRSFAEKALVKEDAGVGTLVATMAAQDDDKGRDGEIRYSIRGGSGLGVFSIEEETGMIRTQEALDHESTPHYWLSVYATDRGVVPLSAMVEVFIQVQDVNDNAPQASEAVYYPSVMENSPKDVSVVRIDAVDPDAKSGDKLAYRITSGNPQGFFAINPRTGLLTTTSRKLDREQQDEHILEVTITDQGVPAKSATVRVIVRVLDENDNRPLFLEKIYKIKLPERERGPDKERPAARRDPVYRVVASDRDGGANAEISYSIEEGDEEGKFFIEPKTGAVSSKKFSAAGEYDILTIKAVDNGRPQKSSTCRLHIEWIPKPVVPEDAAPLLFEESPFSFSVMESDPVAHMVGVVATESSDVPVWFHVSGGIEDTEMFYVLQMACDHNCTAEGGNYDSRFDVGKASGTLIVARPLDAEQKSNYNLTVEATDGTRTVSTQVLIRVIDTNNHRPEFSRAKYEASVPEDLPAGSEVLRVEARDQDEKNKLTFTLLSSTDPVSLKKFKLDPGTGTLYTAEALDHETARSHVLTVMVRDQDIPVKRNLVRVVVNVEDANDNAPSFVGTPYSARVYETAAVGSAVLQVLALDKDTGRNAQIVYSIESGNVANSFAVDPVLGTVTVAKELSRGGVFELTVKATDGGARPLSASTAVRVEVTVSDNAAPKFPERDFSAEVGESAPPGTFVSSMAAVGRSSVFYQIKSGNEDGAFDVNPNSGVVVTRKELDYEARPRYRLVVEGTNMAGLSGNASLTVHVRDENDNAPVFRRREFRGLVDESAPTGSVVLTPEKTPLVVRAFDADSERNAMLTYEIVQPSALDYFAVDPATGAVRVAGALDHERQSVYRFAVRVHDLGRPRLFAETEANVTVEVADVNDCPPVFARDVYEAAVALPTYVGVRVAELDASDRDSGARLLYSIAEGNIGDKFQIGAETGVVSIRNVTQLRSRYELKVRVSDGRFAAVAAVNVQLRENKENGRAQFTRESYRASVPENLTEKTTVEVIAVAANRLNEPLFYRILNPDQHFQIGRTSGAVSTTGVTFDREIQDSFHLVVEVTKEDPSVDPAHVVLTITVEDVNDNAPVFLNLPYHALVRMDAEVGQVVRRVVAADQDHGSNAEITYRLKEPQEHFDINPSGEITVKKPFEADSPDAIFLLMVVATDGGRPALSAEAEVRITATDRAVPVFQKAFYEAEIPEDVPVDTPVLHVQAGDSEGPRVVYTLAEGDPLRRFSVDFDTGVLHVAQPLDFETHPAYRLVIRATDALTGAQSDVFADVILGDVNDNPPQFPAEAYRAEVSEASTVGTSVLKVEAKDLDAGRNGEVFYQLVEEEGAGQAGFAVDRDTGLVSTARPLDREETRSHRLTIRAVDGGVPALTGEVTLTVDVTDLNDNAPVFVQPVYEASVSELAPRGHFVTRVQAWDADDSDSDKLEFAIVSGNEDQSFAVDKHTGALVLSNHRRLQMRPTYRLNVSVSDGVYQSSAAVEVAVTGANFHAPAFSQTEYVVELVENSPVGTSVAEARATDDDEGLYGKLDYRIVNDAAKDKFSVDQTGRVTTSEILDRDGGADKVIPVFLEARDGGGKVGFCTVNVVLTDVNDNAPQFRAAEYKAAVASDAPRGTWVLEVAATDADEGSNADVVYSLEAETENVAENFEIHPTTGVLSTKESLVGLEGQVYVFAVRGQDTGTPPRHSLVRAYVSVVAPDTPVPKFGEPHYRYALAEDLPVGAEIAAIRAESRLPLTYALVNGNTPESNRDQVFAVDPDTGVLRLQKTLDHETTKWYQLTLRAQGLHEGHQVATSVDINVQVKDLNDNDPVFESDPYQATAAENLPAGTRVIRVRASDPDSGADGHVRYSLDGEKNPPEVGELFAVDGESGWLSTLKELDREKRAHYSVAVLAVDRGEKMRRTGATRVEVTVADVNDNPPRFTAEVYKGTVSEDDPPPSGVIAILATSDGDSEEINRQVSYFITGGDPLGQFAVEQVQNEWKVLVRKPLDRETTDYYLLNVTASDGTFTAKAVVEVKVLDANDNSPVCQKSLYSESVPENSASNRLVLQVSASDADIRSNAQISYELHGAGSELFLIDPETGELKTLKPLDREEREEHRFKVRAVDGGGRFCEADVHVTVRDVNDNAPVFAADPYAFTVFENTQTGTFVAKLQADDTDSGPNGEVSYSLSDSADGWFAIDENSGVLSLAKPLDREAKALYELEARAVDRGEPRLRATCRVLISVLDINDNPPVFERREYAAAVAEDAFAGGHVLRVRAASRDPDADGEIRYAIVGGNEHGAFAVDAATGDIFVIAPLDYETSPEYYLTVEATDGGSPPLADTATVSINVTDVNDNQPVFGQRVYSAVVGEDAEPGRTVLTVTAEDADSPSYSRVRYAIADGNSGTPFVVDPLHGHLKVARHLDREQTSGYTLTLLAVDNGTPPLSASVVVNVDISDVNDNPPLFSQANYSIIVQENQAPGTSVLQLQVSDRDASHNGPPFAFAIADGNAGSAFRIDASGALLLAAPLSKKEREHYLLRVQVSDSGEPPLDSGAFIGVRVIEESVYPPAVLPLDILVSTAGEEYGGGVLGKIHATDQDVYDTLRYGLAPPSPPAFAVSPSDGKVIALRPLDAGHYALNVTVTDGRFWATAPVNVHVRRAARRALDNSLAVRLANVAPEEFVGDHWRDFQRALRNVAGLRRNDVQLLSLQPSSERAADLDVLLAIERAGSPHEVVFRKLNSSASAMEEMTGVRILRVFQKLCAGADCPLRFCDEEVWLDGAAVSTYSTARLSFVAPRHLRRATCQCRGAECPALNNVCDASPCPEGTHCQADERSDAKYTCVCPQGHKNKCSDGHSLTFSGNSYVKYHLLENDNKEQMKLSLRLRTFSPHATVMFAKGTDYSILEIVNGRLQYLFDCGSGPGLVSVHSAAVNDGEWHSVSLEVDGNYAKLVLDGVHAASGKAPGNLRTLNLDDSLYFGGHARRHAARPGREPPGAEGFRGCLEAMALNGLELPLNTQARPAHAVVEAMEDVTPGCALSPPGTCAANPCANGGVCNARPGGGYVCKCPAPFAGVHCELSPCASNPCLYGGTCVPRGDEFYCQCRGQYSGLRCQLGPFCTDNPCKNNGKCIDSLDGPVCECQDGFQGDRCLGDIDECTKNPCGAGGRCRNTYGSYECDCSAGFAGPACEPAAEIRDGLISTAWNIGPEEAVGIVVFVSSIFILALFFVVLRKKACRGKGRSEGGGVQGRSPPPHSFLQRPYLDAKFNKNVYSDVPPQVPVRPISYTPSVPSDSRNNLDRNSFEGSAIPEHPEFSTFNPDAAHGHRKTVAVCSVAPNLPPPPPSNSASDSDSIRKPSWDYDYDAKVVDLDCVTKKPVEESASHPFNTRGSMSEVQSLSSFQSESCDDNESFLARERRNTRGYHWDTSDWMPSVQLPGIEEFPQYELTDSPPTTLYSDPSAMDADYYPGGYDIESDFPPPPDDFPSGDELPPPPPPPEYGDTLRSSVSPRGPAPPPEHYAPYTATPRGQGRGFDEASLSLYASTASCSDMSACCEESEATISDYESGDDGHFERPLVPPQGSQQHTEV
ncbi:protocadherin Fat 1a [Stigmatopora nigra]